MPPTNTCANREATAVLQSLADALRDHKRNNQTLTLQTPTGTLIGQLLDNIKATYPSKDHYNYSAIARTLWLDDKTIAFNMPPDVGHLTALLLNNHSKLHA